MQRRKHELEGCSMQEVEARSPQAREILIILNDVMDDVVAMHEVGQIALHVLSLIMLHL